MHTDDDLKKLLEDLRTMKDEGRWGPLPMRRAADLVTPILRSATGKLLGDLEELWSYARAAQRPMPFVFRLEPYSSVAHERKLWRIKALITIVQAFSHPRRWAVPKNLDPELGTVAAARELAGASWKEFARLQGSAILDRVSEVLIYAERSLPPTQSAPKAIMLDGCHVIHHGKELPKLLTRTQRRFLGLLIDANGQEVSPKAFADVGIDHPTKTKQRLIAEPAFKFLDRYIFAGRQLKRSYFLKQS